MMLQVSVELGSESADFATALAKTRLAEMKKPRMIRLPMHRASGPSPPRSSRSKSKEMFLILYVYYMMMNTLFAKSIHHHHVVVVDPECTCQSSMHPAPHAAIIIIII